MNMTNADYTAIRNDMNKALAEVGAKYGINFTVGNITYDEFGFDAKVKAKAERVNGMSGEQAEFVGLCKSFGFEASDYNALVVHEGKEYLLKGFLPKGRKYTCRLDTRDGKSIKATVEFVKGHMVKA